MVRNRLFFCSLVCVSLPAAGLRGQDLDAPVRAGGDGRRVHVISRVPGRPPVIDGRIDDPAWRGAEIATGFTQRAPNPGQPATERTEVRLLYTNSAIYVAARMYDPAPDSIIARLARRDADIVSDWFSVGFDSYYDRRTAFVFSVNPLGMEQDFFLYDDTELDRSWDAVWDAAARIDALGWTAEYRIPLSQLRFASSDEQVWGIQFQRIIARRDEASYWVPQPPNAAGFVSLWGDLRGIEGIEPPRRLEFRPYSVARLIRAPADAGNPFYEENATFTTIGADLQYGITPNLTLTATFNPDFGQVEADPSVVNLTAYETFFPEKRPFFTEGVDIFNFGLGLVEPPQNETLFYSRRIGRAPHRRYDPDATVDAPRATTILGAAKLSGKTASGWSIGFLNAVMAEETARVFDGDETRQMVAEPLTNYLVGRVIKDFRAGRSAFGAIVTATHRRLDGTGLPLHTAAYTGGLDGRHRFGGGDYRIGGFLLGSHVRGSTEAIARTQRSPVRYFQRPDAQHLNFDSTRTSLTGLSGHLNIGRIGGGHWRWSTNLTFRTPGFEANDLGFMRMADAYGANVRVSYLQFEPGPLFRDWNVALLTGFNRTFGGEFHGAGLFLEGRGQLNNFWTLYGSVVRIWPDQEVEALRGGPALQTPGRLEGTVRVGSDPRAKVVGTLEGNFRMEDDTDAYAWEITPEISVRPSTRSNISLAARFVRNVSAWQYVLQEPTADGSVRYLGAHLDQTTAALTARISYTFAPGLSFQLYAQPFVSVGDYSNVRRVADSASPAFNERFEPVPVPRPDITGFNIRQFRTNAVLRWEYNSGSTLFLVWSQGRNDVGGTGTVFDFTRDFGRLFGFEDAYRVPTTNTFLIKLNYWLGL